MGAKTSVAESFWSLRIGNARSESLTKGSLSDDSDSTLGSFRVRLDLGLRVLHHSQPRREATRPRSSKKERTIIFPLGGVPRGREKASGGHLSAAVPARRREKFKYDHYSIFFFFFFFFKFPKDIGPQKNLTGPLRARLLLGMSATSRVCTTTGSASECFVLSLQVEICLYLG